MVSNGINKIVWNIQWGNHWDDTKEFVYYITKPNFVYQIGKPLTWNDFESKPFCYLHKFISGYHQINLKYQSWQKLKH